MSLSFFSSNGMDFLAFDGSAILLVIGGAFIGYIETDLCDGNGRECGKDGDDGENGSNSHEAIIRQK